MLLLFALALAAANDDVDALKSAAKEAAAEERYCDAHGYFQALFARTGELKHLYNAAEVARAAKDNVAALTTYRLVAQQATPEFPERERVARVIAELEAALASGDLGTACPAAPPLPDVVIEKPPAPDAPVVGRGLAPRSEPATDEETSTLVIVGGVVASAGIVVSIGFGSWALVLESQLHTRAPDVTRAEKDAALAIGVPVVVAATVGVVATGVGATLVVMGIE